MPLIDYKCEKCNSEFFELIRDESEKPQCPACGNDEVRRVYKGKFYGKNGASCSGGCSTCSGCH